MRAGRSQLLSLDWPAVRPRAAPQRRRNPHSGAEGRRRRGAVARIGSSTGSSAAYSRQRSRRTIQRSRTRCQREVGRSRPRTVSPESNELSFAVTVIELPAVTFPRLRDDTSISGPGSQPVIRPRECDVLVLRSWSYVSRHPSRVHVGPTVAFDRVIALLLGRLCRKYLEDPGFITESGHSRRHDARDGRVFGSGPYPRERRDAGYSGYYTDISESGGGHSLVTEVDTAQWSPRLPLRGRTGRSPVGSCVCAPGVGT